MSNLTRKRSALTSVSDDYWPTNLLNNELGPKYSGKKQRQLPNTFQSYMSLNLLHVQKEFSYLI